MISLESHKITESDEISSTRIAAILKMFLCRVSRVVPYSCHGKMRYLLMYLLYLTLKVRYRQYLIS